MKLNVLYIYLVKLITSQTECKLTIEKLDHSEEKIDSMTNLIEKLQDDLSKRDKEVSDINKSSKSDIGKIMDELKRIRDKWIPPERFTEQSKYIEDLERTNKSLKDDINRKKDMIQNLRSQLNEYKDKETNNQNVKTLNEKEASENIDKIKTMSKDIQRKDNMIKEMKSNLDALKESDKKNQDEISQLQEKLKITKIDLQRKMEIIKELKEKVKDSSNVTDVSLNNKVDELNANIKKLKNDIDRKDGMIKTLKAKLEATNVELDQQKEFTTKMSKTTLTEVEREQKQHDNTRRRVDNLTITKENLLIIIRRVFKDLIQTYEKLRSKSNVYNSKGIQEGLNILGVTQDELDEYLSPKADLHEKVNQILSEEEIDSDRLIEIYYTLKEKIFEFEKILKQISEKDTNKENRVDEYFKKNPIIKNHEIRKIQSGNLNSIK
jgi:hypothetical protein